MKVEAVLVTKLPALAWGLEVSRVSKRALLLHGSNVEVGPDYFVEGAWNGRFADLAFVQATTFSGSGGQCDGKDWLVSSSTHTLQPIYIIRTSDSLVASNSLMLVLQIAGTELHRQYRYHDVDLMSIMLGLRRYKRNLPTSSGARLDLFYHCNLRVTPRLDVLPQSKQRLSSFTTYSQYVEVLLQQTSSVVANAADPGRGTRYRPLTTISSGYDSPACAVLARAAGCAEAITFAEAAEPFGRQNDSGLQIGRILGLRTTELDPGAYKEVNDLPEVEFLAPGYGGDDVIFRSAEAILANSLLFTGYHGDRVWGRSKDRGSNIERGDPSGGSLLEFRLRTCFIVLPVPFIGCEHFEAIRGISNSAEMSPWSLQEAGYDRPIPRRLVEEAGVPRSYFGQIKKAAARPARAADIEDPQIDKYLSDVSLANFSAWSENVPLFTGAWDHVRHYVLNRIYAAFAWLAERLHDAFPHSRGLGIYGLFWQRRGPVDWRYAKPRNPQSLLIFWAHARLRDRYANLFDADRDAKTRTGAHA